MQYPDEGELYKATAPDAAKKIKHLVFFVHFFGGHPKALKRHIALVNELGYDAYVFKLKDSLKEHQYIPYSPVSKKFGLKHALADQIEEHLNLLPQYKTKIVFAFSNVAGCAIETLARRQGAEQNQDVIALICDSGPGAAFMYSSYKLIEHEMQIKSVVLKMMTTPIVMFSWSPARHKDIPKDLQKLPNHFPVLSIRGWKDKLISPAHIDQIFEPAKNINWRKLALPEAEHLSGLRDFAEEYRTGLVAFLLDLP